MPGIFIGIGGIGGTIVAEVRQTLEVRVAQACDSPSAKTAAGQFQFLLIDTWKDGAAQGFEASSASICPRARTSSTSMPGSTPGTSAAIRLSPVGGRKRGLPLKVGSYASGAGQLRFKGKLAYRTALTGQAAQVVPAVQNALKVIDDVHGPAAGIRTVPVYIVCSLGGGTGSGMVLTFAQHLRQSLPGYCPLIGVFPLAGLRNWDRVRRTGPDSGPTPTRPCARSTIASAWLARRRTS